MSGSRARTARDAANEEEPGAGEGGGDEARVHLERRARVQGWKPLDEFKGDPAIWRDAEEFIERGEQELPVLRERLRQMEGRTIKAERHTAEALQVVTDVSERLRSADERAMKRARKELETKRREAIEAGDVAAADQAQQELDEIKATPAPAPKTAPVRQAAEAAPANLPPEVHAWGQRNPWFRRDPDLQTAATALHVQLLQSDPDLGLAENLERVTEAMRLLYPNRVDPVSRPKPKPKAAEEGDEEDDGEVLAREVDPALARRRQPAAVASSRSASMRGGGGTKSFDAMPADSKAAFVRYERAIASKPGTAKPLTKAEWAATYWEQFEE